MFFLSFKMNDGHPLKKMNDGYISIVDCTTTQTILRDKIFFNLILTSASVSTIYSISNLAEVFERANLKAIKSYFVRNQKFNNPKIFYLA